MILKYTKFRLQWDKTSVADLHSKILDAVVMRDDREVYSVSCIGVLPFIEGSLGDGTSGLVAVSRDSAEHA